MAKGNPSNDNFTYNGRRTTAPEFGIRSVMRISRALAAETVDRTMKISGRDGEWDMGANLGPKTHPVRIAIKGENEFKLREHAREISAWLDHKNLHPLIFDDEPDKQYFARRRGEILPDEIIHMGFADIQLYCPDPHAYALSTRATSPNRGTASTPVRIVATMSNDASGLDIRLSDTDNNGPYIAINTALNTGDTITIDTAQGWVSINGLDARQYVTYDSEVRGFVLPVGEFELAADNAILDIVYRERWV